jgi:hypothetical protein
MKFLVALVAALRFAPAATTSAPAPIPRSNLNLKQCKTNACEAKQVRGGADGGTRKLTSLELAGAGAFSTMVGDLTMHPIDCIKTLQQSGEGRGLSMLGASKKILEQSGPAGFLSGAGTYVVSDGMAGAIKFAR